MGLYILWISIHGVLLVFMTSYSLCFWLQSLAVSGTDSLEVCIPYIRLIVQAYVWEDLHTTWLYVVRYLIDFVIPMFFCLISATELSVEDRT